MANHNGPTTKNQAIERLTQTLAQFERDYPHEIIQVLIQLSEKVEATRESLKS